MSGKHDAVCMYRGHTLDFGRSQKRSEAWVWAAVLKGELEVVSSQGGAGSQHPRGEWPQQQGAGKDLRGSQGRARISCLGEQVLENSCQMYTERMSEAWCILLVWERVCWVSRCCRDCGFGWRFSFLGNVAAQPSMFPHERQLQPLKCHHLLLARNNLSSVALSVSQLGPFPFSLLCYS